MKLLLISAAVLIATAVPGCVPEDKRATGVKKAAVADDPAFDPPKLSMSGTADKTETAATPANIGDTVSIGVFDYTVQDVSFRKTVTSGAMHETAGGVFLLVTLTFTNHDRQSHAVDTPLVRLTDAKNAEYECSGAASNILAMNGKNRICSRECGPGKTIKGTMVFDVPSKDKGYRLKVSDGAWKESTREIRLIATEDDIAVPQSGDRLK